ncbi:MAG: GNAT family protein [Candidatus Nanopelagicales bacterium]
MDEVGPAAREHLLRPLRPGDLDALLVIQHEGSVAVLGAVFPQDRYPFPAADIRRRWESELADPAVECFAIVGGDDEDLDGFAAVRGAELLHLGTARRTWGSGLAGRAHDELLEHLASREVDLAFLRVFEANERARRFYARRGWTEVGPPSRSEFEPHPVLLRYERTL